MINHKNVRGTSSDIFSLEVNVDTVYVRSNIRRIEEDDFNGWEYDEIQYDVKEYIEYISEVGRRNEEALDLLLTEVIPSFVGGN